MERQTLREAFSDWRDWDSAGLALAVCLGLMPPPAPGGGWGNAKHVFWSNHPVGNALAKILDDLAAAGVLERRDDPDIQYRWNPSFRGDWSDDGDDAAAHHDRGRCS